MNPIEPSLCLTLFQRHTSHAENNPSIHIFVPLHFRGAQGAQLWTPSSHLFVLLYFRGAQSAQLWTLSSHLFVPLYFRGVQGCTPMTAIKPCLHQTLFQRRTRRTPMNREIFFVRPVANPFMGYHKPHIAFTRSWALLSNLFASLYFRGAQGAHQWPLPSHLSFQLYFRGAQGAQLWPPKSHVLLPHYFRGAQLSPHLKQSLHLTLFQRRTAMTPNSIWHHNQYPLQAISSSPFISEAHTQYPLKDISVSYFILEAHKAHKQYPFKPSLCPTLF